MLVLSVSTIKKFSIDEMDTLREMIIQEPLQFLMLSKTKQELLVDKIAQRLVSIFTMNSHQNRYKCSQGWLFDLINYFFQKYFLLCIYTICCHFLSTSGHVHRGLHR